MSEFVVLKAAKVSVPEAWQLLGISLLEPSGMAEDTLNHPATVAQKSPRRIATLSKTTPSALSSLDPNSL
jgi:hypothetical protein